MLIYCITMVQGKKDNLRGFLGVRRIDRVPNVGVGKSYGVVKG